MTIISKFITFYIVIKYLHAYLKQANTYKYFIIINLGLFKKSVFDLRNYLINNLLFLFLFNKILKLHF